MKVTTWYERTTTTKCEEVQTVPWDVHPDSIVVESVLVRIEPLQRMLVSRVIAIHRGIVLMTEHNPGAGDTFS